MDNIKLISEFMGYRMWKPWIARVKYLDHTMISTPYGSFDKKEFARKFHSDWNWLKMVINEIGKIPYAEKDGMREYMAINWSDTKVNIYTPIDEMYEIVVEFIKWYNDEG